MIPLNLRRWAAWGWFHHRAHRSSWRLGNLISWLFRIVISPSIGADFRLIPHEIYFISMGCRHILLGNRSRTVHMKAGIPHIKWLVGWLGFYMGLWEHAVALQAIDFYAISWGIFRKPAWNLGETVKRKSQIQENRAEKTLQQEELVTVVDFILLAY